MNPTTIRRIAVPVALILLVILAIPLILRARGSAQLDQAVEAFKAEVGPLTMAEYQPPRLEREENAGVWLLAAAQATILPKLDRRLLADLQDLPTASWTPEQQANVTRILGQTEATFTLLERTLTLDSSNFELNYSLGGDMPIPNFVEILTVQRLVEIKARKALAEGNLEEFRNAALILARSARTLLSESILISQLVGFSVEQGFVAVVREALAAGVSDVALLRQLEQSIDGVDLRDAVRRSLGAEASMLFAVTPKQLAEMNSNHDGTPLSSLPFKLPGADDRSWVALVLDQYRQISAELERPLADLYAQYGQATPALDSDTIASRLAANFDHTVHRSMTINGLRHLARQAVKIQIAAIEAGAYPPNAAQNSANPYTGNDLEYMATTGSSARLTADGAAEIYLKLAPERSRRAAPLFSWNLLLPTD